MAHPIIEQKNKEQLTDVLRNQVLASVDLDQIENLEGYIETSEADDYLAGFCDYFDLGNWFYEAILENDIDVESLMDSLKAELILEGQEADKERDEVDRDLRRAQGGW